jgi:hypothetical protein
MLYKGRNIESPLSDDDRKFLQSRGKDVLISQFDEQERAAKAREAQLAELGVDSESNDGPVDYNDWNVDELRSEITERRKAADDDGDEERADALSGKGKKADLVKQLKDDDELLADDSTQE